MYCKINKFASMKTINYKGVDLSSATAFDIAKIHPNFVPLVISPNEEMNEEKLRILSIWVYADNYKISELKEILKKEFKTIYPDLF